MTNHIPRMAHVIQLALCASMSNLGVTDYTKSWDAHEHDQQFGENESTNIGKSQRLPREGNARMNKVSVMRPGLAKIIEKVHITSHFERPETNFHIAESALCVDYSDTWSSKRVHRLSKGHRMNSSTT